MQVWKPILFTLCASSLAPAASREIVELQRDMASLTQQVRTLQTTLDERLAAINTLVERTLDSVNKTNTSMTVLENGLRERLSQQLSAPVAGMSSRMDQMGTDFTAVRESLADLNERMAKMQAQIADLSNTVKVLQSPAAPPPLGSTSGPPPGMSSNQLFESATRDRSSGNLDLAMQGFQEYLKWFGNSDLAPSAQFNVGQIQYDKGDFKAAVDSFDAVLERFPENNKTADAMYMKGMALLKAGQRNEAGKEFLSVIQKYPTADVTAKARAQRRALGLSVPASSKSRR
jgi:tol-pal system protein YbgF